MTKLSLAMPPTPVRPFRAILGMLGACLALVGCDRPGPTQDVRPAPRPTTVSRAVAIQDVTMGSLTVTAQAIAAAMQDQPVRTAVIAAMKDSASLGVGLDLTDCANSALAKAIFDAGERRGAATAASQCTAAASLPGLVLYMDREQLAAWSATTIPVVTAIAQPGRALPAHYVGYRSPTRTLDIGADPKLQTPILVLLPIVHPARMQSHRGALTPSSVVHKDTATAVHPPSQP